MGVPCGVDRHPVRKNCQRHLTANLDTLPGTSILSEGGTRAQFSAGDAEVEGSFVLGLVSPLSFGAFTRQWIDRAAEFRRERFTPRL